MKKRLVLKLGSHVLTSGKSCISSEKITDVANQLAKLKEKYDVVLVSSGAIAAAKEFLGNTKHQLDKQALAAIGQPILMTTYQKVFHKQQMGVAQCLLTYSDFRREISVKNTTRLFENLWKEDFIPIVNENDAIATDEIKFGDNDKLAALTANLIDADLLVLASDINGLYTDDPKENPEAELLKQVSDLDSVRSFIKDSKTKLGSGGMTSKFLAAEICMKNNIEMYIVNGMRNNFLIRTLANETDFTCFKKD